MIHRHARVCQSLLEHLLTADRNVLAITIARIIWHASTRSVKTLVQDRVVRMQNVVWSAIHQCVFVHQALPAMLSPNVL